MTARPTRRPPTSTRSPARSRFVCHAYTHHRRSTLISPLPAGTSGVGRGHSRRSPSPTDAGGSSGLVGSPAGRSGSLYPPGEGSPTGDPTTRDDPQPLNALDGKRGIPCPASRKPPSGSSRSRSACGVTLATPSAPTSVASAATVTSAQRRRNRGPRRYRPLGYPSSRFRRQYYSR